jgi:hypothetical protein
MSIKFNDYMSIEPMGKAMIKEFEALPDVTIKKQGINYRQLEFYKCNCCALLKHISTSSLENSTIV